MAPAGAPTPLLDRQQPVPQPRKGSLMLLRVIGGAIGAVIGIAAIRLAPSDLLPLWLIGFLAVEVLGVMLHELGHLAAGKLAGFDFYQIVAGPFMMTRESAGYKLRFLPRRILLSAGHTLMIPRTTKNLRRDFAIFAAGGPVVTALLFVPLLVIPWGPAAGCLLAANAVLAAFSWIPMSIGGSHTDGKVLLTLAGKNASSERFAAILYVMAIDTRGAAPAEWPREVLARLAEHRPESEFRGEAAVLLAIHALDSGDPAATACALENVLANYTRLRPDLRRPFFAEAAFFQGVYRRNAALAAQWLEDARKIKGGVALKDWDAAALAAVALAQGKNEEARQQLGRAIAFLDRQPGARGSVLAARRRLAAVHLGN